MILPVKIEITGMEKPAPGSVMLYWLTTIISTGTPPPPVPPGPPPPKPPTLSDLLTAINAAADRIIASIKGA